GFRHGRRESWPGACAVSTGSPPSRCSLRPRSQAAAQLRPEKRQRSARKRSHSANTRTVPTPRTAAFLTHRLTIASENSRQPRVSGGEKSVTRAAHAAAITTTSARSKNRRLVIPVAPGLHLGGLDGRGPHRPTP